MNRIITKLSFLILFFTLNSLIAYSQNETLNDLSEVTIAEDSTLINKSEVEYGVGFSLEYPGGFNVNFDYVNNNLVSGFALGFYDDYIIGMEANLRYRLKIIGRIYLEPQIVGGFQYFEVDNIKLKSYFGVALGINIYGLFIAYGRVNHSIFTYYKLSNPEYIKLGYILYF